MVRDYPSDTGHFPLEIWQIIAGKMDFRDWGRAAASACRVFHALQPGTYASVCANELNGACEDVLNLGVLQVYYDVPHTALLS